MKKGILIDVQNRQVTEVQIEDGIDSIYEQIKCDTFDCVQIHEENDVYVDDNGLSGLTDKSMFFSYKGYPDPLPGNGLILGIDHETGESIDTTLTIDEVKKNVKFLSLFDIQLMSRFGVLN
jgi:hypothetical protein